MDNAVIAQRVKETVKQKGMKMSFFTQQIGVRANYFTDCANPKKSVIIPDDLLERVAIYLETTIQYLKGETDDPNFHLSSVGMKVIPAEKENTRPVYGRVSAGTGVIAEQEVLGYESIGSEYEDGDYFWLQVQGDSMSPVITDKDLVLIEKDAPLESGNVMAVVVDDDEGFIKKVSIDDDTVTLHSFNPYYPPMVFGGAEIGRLRFIGKVVEQKRKY